MPDKTRRCTETDDSNTPPYDVTERRANLLLKQAVWGDPPSSAQGASAGPEINVCGYPADPQFQLRGGHSNLMVDAAMPLFGLAMRLRTLDALPHIAALRQQVHTQICAILEEVGQRGYDAIQMQAYSYALCLHLDEIVMATPWGSNSVWSGRTLLSDFHQDTQGGEKIFAVLSRMMQEPERFQDVLEFVYLCLCFGLKGKYALEPKGDELLDALITELHGIIRQLRGPVPEDVCDPYTNVVMRPYKKPRDWLPWWSPLVISALAMVAAYNYYSYRLGLLTAEVLESLDLILQQ
ncbi:type IVB secretion system protein IcmH/DotU [Pseudomonas putida]|uniref:type IVB secretion system protein IcmH/DotU n=1 Tax=Pseudomonas putida TaxID=303 RepID=UPI00227158D1|nr:type IVB secretion system protein IcmH/DotU [Pseudomonas putida]WAB96791.1 type IVB secretion system protein IcmH/DotU [Pseudomonas putida]